MSWEDSELIAQSKVDRRCVPNGELMRSELSQLFSTTLFKDLNVRVSKNGIVNATVEAIDAAIITTLKLCIGNVRLK